MSLFIQKNARDITVKSLGQMLNVLSKQKENYIYLFKWNSKCCKDITIINIQ